MSPPPSSDAGCSVRVAVRVRPLLSFEKTERLGECLRCIPESKQLWVGDGGENGRNTFTFDYTFPKSCEQRLLYDECVASLLEAFFEGFNATILAYGQTGSGKTYTMGSASSLRVAEEEHGIIPRVITGMYDLLREASEERPHISYTVRCQFLEIYGEDIHDLLEPAGSTVSIREGQNGEVNVHGAKEMLVNGAEELAVLLERGSLCRTTGSTLMNAHSSRSHAIFTVLLEQRIRPEGLSPVADDKADPDDVEIRRSKFHFVDLAGSERAKRTGASGQRFKEGVDINKGLLTLGNVISALGDDSKRGKVHVPYRDSKLTRMLQDSLGGNSQTLMICCVSPAESNMHETLSALRYANRARNIKNKPVVNRDASSIVIHELREKVQALAAELLRIRSGGSVDGSAGEGGEGGVSSATLRELAVASTPSLQPPKPLTRASSVRGGMMEIPPPVQRELTLLRARAAEAETEVQRLTEEAKRARMRESKKDDELAEMRAELDLTHADMEALKGGTSPDLLMGEIADAARGGSNNGRKSSSGSSKGGISEMIKGFLSGSGSGSGSGSFTDGGNSSEAAQANVGGKIEEAPAKGGRAEMRQRALSVVKDFHKQIQGLEEKLHESERQRAMLERQLVDQAGDGDGSGYDGGSDVRGVGLSERMAAAVMTTGDGAGVSSNPVAEAEKRLAEEKRRREELIARLGAGSDASAQSGVKIFSDDEDDDDDEEDDDDDGDNDEEGGEDGSGNGESVARKTSEASLRDQEERALRKSETKITAELSDLDRSIMDKEALLAQIKQTQASYETMQQHYEHKLREMDLEVQRHEQEHERLLADLEKLEKLTEVAVQEEREKLKKQLEEKTEALKKAKERQSELGTLARVRRKKDEEVRTLESEIMKMKRDKVELQRRLGVEQKRQREILMQKSKEIMSLKRSAAKDQAEVKRLERAKNKAEAVSKRHLDELAFIRRIQRQKLGVGQKQKLTAQEKDAKKLIDAKMKELARAEEAADRLSAEYEKKLKLLQQKERLEIVKASITSRRESRQTRVRDARAHSRSSPFGVRENRSRGHSPRAASRVGKHQTTQMGATDHQLSRSGSESNGGDASGRAVTAATEVEEITLRAALPAEGGLDQEELDTLREVEERLESNKAQLEFKERNILSIQREVDAWAEKRRLRQRGAGDGSGSGGFGQDQGGENAPRAEVGEAQMIEELESSLSDLKGAKGIIRVLFSSLVSTRRGLKQKSGAVKALQEQLNKKAQALEDTQELRQTEQRSYDRKVTAITAEYERKINGFLNHTALSGLLHESIERSRGQGVSTSPGDAAAAAAVSGASVSGVESGSDRGGGGRAGTVGDASTQDIMAKVLHERYLSEREKVKTLHARLKESKAKIGDLEEVNENQQKAFVQKQHDEEWLTYELKVYRSRCIELRDEKRQLKSELDRMRRMMSGNGNGGRHHANASSASHWRGHGPSGHAASSLLGPPPGAQTSSPPTRPPSPVQRSHSGRGLASRDPATASPGTSPSRRYEVEFASPEPILEKGKRVKGSSPGSGDQGAMSPPENPASEVGSEFDDVDLVDEPDSEGGDTVFMGVTNDLEAIREGKMPESMQLVARVNAEAGGKESVFDRLATTTTESRRLKVNDRDQLQENLRRKAKQEALRKKKDFKVGPGHLSPTISLQPQAMRLIGGASASEAAGSQDARNLAGSDGGRFAHTHSASSGNRSGSRSSLDDASAGSVGTVGSSSTSRSGGTEGGGKEQSVFERLQAPIRRFEEYDKLLGPSSYRAKTPAKLLKVPGNSAKSGGSTHKKYVKMGGGPPVPSSKVFSQSELDALRASGNSGSPFRAVVTGADGRDRSANNDVSLDTMVEEGHVSKKEKKPPGMTSGSSRGSSSATTGIPSSCGDVFDRLPYNFTESERKRRQPEAIATGGRQVFSHRRSLDRDATALSAAAAVSTAAAGTEASNTVSRRSVETDVGASRSDDRSGR